MRAILLLLSLLPAVGLAQPNDAWRPYTEQIDATARVAYVRALAEDPSTKNLRLVVAAMTDMDGTVRDAAIGVLRQHKSMRVFDLIVEGMPKGSQYHAGLFLGSDFWEEEYVLRMIKLLKHEDDGIRRSIALALGTIRDDRALLPLIQMARDPNQLAREIAKASLVKYNKPKNKASLRKLVAHQDQRISQMALDVLKAQG